MILRNKIKIDYKTDETAVLFVLSYYWIISIVLFYVHLHYILLLWLNADFVVLLLFYRCFRHTSKLPATTKRSSITTETTVNQSPLVTNIFRKMPHIESRSLTKGLPNSIQGNQNLTFSKQPATSQRCQSIGATDVLQPQKVYSAPQEAPVNGSSVMDASKKNAGSSCDDENTCKANTSGREKHFRFNIEFPCPRNNTKRAS